MLRLPRLNLKSLNDALLSGSLRGGDKNRNVLREGWDRLAKVPKGNLIYSRLVRRMVPYTGTIPAVVTELSRGAAVVTMRDTPGVRNHLHSIHAVALANLGEFATGIALYYALPPRARCILTRFEITYEKKARGTLSAHAHFEVPDWGPHQKFVVEGEIRDGAGERVASVAATWLVDAQ